MNRHMRNWIITAAALTLAGALLLVGVMAVLDFDLTRLSTQKLQTNTYEYTEDFTGISIHVETASVRILPAEQDSCRVVCLEENTLWHTVKIEDGILKIQAQDNRKWYDYICINWKMPTVSVYLPRAAYDALRVEGVTGNIDIPDGFSFETVTLAATTGNISSYASVKESLEIRVKTGNVILGKTNAREVKVSATTGNMELMDMSCHTLRAESTTGRIHLKNVIAQESMALKNTTGGIWLDACDGQMLSIRTSTGSVKGTLLSGKRFVTETATGSVSVPASADGGQCTITTDTGNIKIEIL